MWMDVPSQETAAADFSRQRCQILVRQYSIRFEHLEYPLVLVISSDVTSNGPSNDRRREGLQHEKRTYCNHVFTPQLLPNC